MTYEILFDGGEKVQVEAEFLNPQPTGDWVFSEKKAIQTPGLKQGEFLTEPLFIARAFLYIKLITKTDTAPIPKSPTKLTLVD